MLVAELLRGKEPGVATVRSDSTLVELVALLRDKNIGAAVVSSDGVSIDGIVSERDLVRSLGTQVDLTSRTVGEIMTSRVITCSPSDRVDQLMSLMTNERIRHLPVETDGRLAGIVSIGDVVKRRVGELESEAQAMIDYIQQGR